MFVLTLTQRDAATQGDRVDQLIASLSTVDAAHPFRRSWGDEAVGGVRAAADAVEVAARALRPGGRAGRRFSVGVGVGPALPVGDKGLTGLGAARSRRAVERGAKAALPLGVEAGPAGVSFEGAPTAPELAASAEAVLRALGDIVAARTDAEWAVVDLLTPGVRGQQREVAAALGISVQAVSQAIARARWARELELRSAAELLLRLAAQAVG